MCYELWNIPFAVSLSPTYYRIEFCICIRNSKSGRHAAVLLPVGCKNRRELDDIIVAALLCFRIKFDFKIEVQIPTIRLVALSHDFWISVQVGRYLRQLWIFVVRLNRSLN
jgi:hypothetical protein